MASSSTPLPPPPKRTVKAEPKPFLPYSSDANIAVSKDETWKAWSKRKTTGWGSFAYTKSISLSDTWGTRFNGWSEAIGSERFWPVTGDFMTHEVDKCARILRAFTIDGIERTVEEKSVKGVKKQRKTFKKIPSRIIRDSCGLAIFTAMRSGMMPFGGAGGAGVVVAKLEDGTWSAPVAMSPNNLTAGAMFGVDIYDCVLVLRTPEALASFYGHKVTVGAELGVVAGPFGAGAAAEVGKERAPVLSYHKSRGFYAGVEAVAQIFITRTEENELAYYWPGVTPKDILTGKTKIPDEVAPLHKAIADAESGKAQRLKGAEFEYEQQTPWELAADLELDEGEALKLPPTPEQMEAEEEEYMKMEAEAGRRERERLEREAVEEKRANELRKVELD